MKKLIVHFDETTTYSILKIDEEYKIALLQNDNSKMYSVATGINTNNEKNCYWDSSSCYTNDYEVAKAIYYNELSKVTSLLKYHVLGYLINEYSNDVDTIDIIDIINYTYEIYLKYDGLSFEEFAKYVLFLYLYQYRKNNISFKESDIYNKLRGIIVDMYYASVE